MFTLIRMGKDSKDRDKDWILCIYNINTMGDIRKENGSIFSLQFLFRCSPPHHFCNKVSYNESDFILTVPVFFFSVLTKLLLLQSYIYIYRQCSRLLSIYNVHSIVNSKFSPCSNSNPGHSTKFVILPSSILLYRFYTFAISYCTHKLM